MRNINLKHKNDSKNVLTTPGDEDVKWVRTEEGIRAFENIKALGLKEIEEGRLIARSPDLLNLLLKK